MLSSCSWRNASECPLPKYVNVTNALSASAVFLTEPQQVAVHWTEVAGSHLDPLWASLEMLRDLIYIRALYSCGVWAVAPLHKKSD